MADPGVFAVIAAEREALAGDLAGLTETQWQSASLCAGWTVQDVVAHMTATARISLASFFPKLLASGFNLSKMQDKDIAVAKGASTAETLANFRDVISSTKSPPGPKTSWLGEAIVHSDDIRRPLSLTHAYPIDALVKVADFYKGSNLIIGAKKRIAGVRLRATDTDWSCGDASSPEAAGPMLALVMAMSGRKSALADLSGEGVAVLDSRG